MIEDQTKKDNVCIAPYDIDGDGQVDFALGADWRPSDTVNSGTIQWLPPRQVARRQVDRLSPSARSRRSTACTGPISTATAARS